jgi:hypothetical protein
VLRCSIAAGISARATRRQPNGGLFAVWWLTTLTGSLGVAIAADLVSFYLFARWSASQPMAWPFLTTPSARRAGNVRFARHPGEAFPIMGFVPWLRAPGSNLLSEGSGGAFGVAVARSRAGVPHPGLGLKTGLVPFMSGCRPPIRPRADPGSRRAERRAVKSRRDWAHPFRLETALPGWGEALVAIGFFSAFYGAARNDGRTPRRCWLFSVSQMGLLAAVLGMGLATGNSSVSNAAAFYAMHTCW